MLATEGARVIARKLNAMVEGGEEAGWGSLAHLIQTRASVFYFTSCNIKTGAMPGTHNSAAGKHSSVERSSCVRTFVAYCMQLAAMAHDQN